MLKAVADIDAVIAIGQNAIGSVTIADLMPVAPAGPPPALTDAVGT